MNTTPLRTNTFHQHTAPAVVEPADPGAARTATVASTHPGDRLLAGQQLWRGDRLDSSNGRVRLVMQTDGNLVLYRNDDNVALWSSHTWNTTVVRAMMQADANLVCYDVFNRALWASGTNGKGGVTAVLQDDGNFVIYTAAGSPVWASNTWHDWSLTSANTDDQHLDTGQWMNSTASAARTGLISGHTRIWTTNEFTGFHGSVFPALFDDQNKMIWPTDIDAAKHQYGVDGTWIPGLPSDRTCYWTNQVPATVLAASHGLGLFQYKDPKNMLMRDLDLIGRAWKDVGPLVQAFVGS